MIDIIIITKNNFAEFVETINSIKSEIEYINKIIIVDDSDENYIDEVLKIINQKEFQLITKEQEMNEKNDLISEIQNYKRIVSDEFREYWRKNNFH